jgi:hypothetical protein
MKKGEWKNHDLSEIIEIALELKKRAEKSTVNKKKDAA